MFGLYLCSCRTFPTPSPLFIGLVFAQLINATFSEDLALAKSGLVTFFVLGVAIKLVLVVDVAGAKWGLALPWKL